MAICSTCSKKLSFFATKYHANRECLCGECAGTRLIAAAEAGDTQTVKQLVRGPLVSFTDSSGATALMRASARGHLDVAQLLVKAGSDVHAKSRKGETAFSLAAGGNHVACAKFLLTSGADPFVKSTSGLDPFTYASMSGDLDIVRLISEHCVRSPTLRRQLEQRVGR
jgi:uncharacterized protein